jgi:hypothetical protein
MPVRASGSARVQVRCGMGGPTAPGAVTVRAQTGTARGTSHQCRSAAMIWASGLPGPRDRAPLRPVQALIVDVVQLSSRSP